MHYIWLLIIVTSCTASHCSADSFIINTYNRTTYRVSDEDFDSLFTDAVVTRSRIYCITLCTTNNTNTFYESNSRRCSCQGICPSYNPVTTGTNYVEKYNAQGKPLNINSDMSTLSSVLTYNDMYQF